MAGHERETSVELHVFGPDRFEDFDIIGEGRNARVYSAWDRELGREVAIKVAIEDTFVEDLGAQGQDAAQFAEFIGKLEQGKGLKANYTLLREARLLAQVEVPGVVAVHELGYVQEGVLAIVMPLLSESGVSHTHPWRDIFDCVLQLGDGLAALHDVGILHRDLKPDNILYDDANRPCIADFGLACEMADEEAMSHFAGTFAWMAPELLLRERPSVQSDLFAFCMLAFHMFYGHSPFADDEAKFVGRVSNIQRADEVPLPIREALLKGLRPLPSDRWSSMHELLAALRETMQPVQPEQQHQPEPEQPKPRRTPWLVAAGFGVAAAIGAALVVVMPEAKADACDEVSRELVDFWNVDVQAELRVVLGTRKATERLESFAVRWVDVRVQECQAAKRGDGSEHASPCTASVRDHLNATVATLRTPYQREGLDFETILAELPAPEYCLEHPEDGQYGSGGLLELRRMDIELGGRLASHDLEAAERLQADYMLAAREISSKYDVARAIHWRAELHRLRGELDQAEEDFKRAYAEAADLRASDFSGEVMLKLVAIAGSKGEFAALEERAFVVKSVFAERRPEKVAELLQVQGLALAEQDPTQRDRGLALLREAVEIREAQYRHYGGTREKVGSALEALARGLIAADRGDEALQLAEQSLDIHESEYGSLTKRAHELRRLVFVAQVLDSKLEDSHQTQKLLTNPLYDAGDYDAFVQESLWVASVYQNAGARIYAENKLKTLLHTVERLELVLLRSQVEDALANYGMEP